MVAAFEQHGLQATRRTQVRLHVGHVRNGHQIVLRTVHDQHRCADAGQQPTQLDQFSDASPDTGPGGAQPTVASITPSALKSGPRDAAWARWGMRRASRAENARQVGFVTTLSRSSSPHSRAHSAQHGCVVSGPQHGCSSRRCRQAYKLICKCHGFETTDGSAKDLVAHPRCVNPLEPAHEFRDDPATGELARQPQRPVLCHPPRLHRRRSARRSGIAFRRLQPRARRRLVAVVRERSRRRPVRRGLRPPARRGHPHRDGRGHLPAADRSPRGRWAGLLRRARVRLHAFRADARTDARTRPRLHPPRSPQLCRHQHAVEGYLRVRTGAPCPLPHGLQFAHLALRSRWRGSLRAPAASPGGT